MIEPRQIIEELKRIDANTDIEAFLQRIYTYLPNCIQRAIGTLQMVQLEPDYKAVRTRLMGEFGFDLHSSVRRQIEVILKRPR